MRTFLHGAGSDGGIIDLTAGETDSGRPDHPSRSISAGAGQAEEEFINFLTHSGGLLLAIAGAVVLFSSVSSHGSEAMRLSCRIYAATLIALYAASALSHSSTGPDWRRFFRSLDQGVIFVFIAANFTPFAVAHVPVPARWIVLAAMWTLALIGFCSKVIWKHQVDAISIRHYLALGWLPVFVIVPIVRSLPVEASVLFAAGGLCYTIGTIFLAMDRRVRYFHATWHLLVIAGSACHFFVVVAYVVPLTAAAGAVASGVAGS